MMNTIYLVTRMLIVSLLLQACMASDKAMAEFSYSPDENDTDKYSDSTDWNDNYFPPTPEDTAPPVGPALLNLEGTPCNAETAAQYALSPAGNAMAGPVLARESLRSGNLPIWPIRAAEFLNYYNIGAPTNETTAPILSIITRPDGATTDGETRVDLRLAVVAPNTVEEDVRPLNLTVAVDTSASMIGNGIARARAACRALADGLKPGDIVSLIAWNMDTETLLNAVPVDNSVRAQTAAICDRLAANPDKGTDLHYGLTAAYESALLNTTADRLNHIIFISDGGAVAGVTDRELIQTYAERIEAADIYLSTFGSAASPAQYNENLMKMFADAGKGEHLYADSDAEAVRLISERYFPALKTVATDLSLRLFLPVGYQAPEGASTVGEIDAEAPGFNLSAGRTLYFHESVSYCDNGGPPSPNEISFALSYASDNAGSDANYLSVADNVSVSAVEGPADAFQLKTEAVLFYVDALRAVMTLNAADAIPHIDAASAVLNEAASAVGQDSDIDEMLSLLSKSKKLLK